MKRKFEFNLNKWAKFGFAHKYEYRYTFNKILILAHI